MLYLAKEWEALQLKKMTHESIIKELMYLIDQAQIRSGQLLTAMRNQRYFNEIQTPVWMIIEDIQRINEQYQRIIDELNRRHIP